MKVELSPGHLYFSTQQEEDGEELSEVDACTVAQAKAEEKLSIVTKLILINDIPLEIIAKVLGKLCKMLDSSQWPLET